MLSWILSSIKNKMLVLLTLLCIVPLLILGITTDIIIIKTLDVRLGFMADQTLKNLSLSITKDLQGLIDLVVYDSTNNLIVKKISEPAGSNAQKEAAFYSIRSQMMQNNIIRNINYPFDYLIIQKNGAIFTNFYYLSEKDRISILKELKKGKWFENLSDSYTYKLYMGVYEHYYLPRSGDQIYVAANVFDGLDNVGVIMLGIDSSYITKLLKNISISKRSSIYIVDDNGNFLLQGDGNFYPYGTLPGSFTSLIARKNIPSSIEINGKKQNVIYNDIYLKEINTDWRIIMVTPMEDFHSDINRINSITFILVSFSLMAVILSIYFINRNFVNPIIRLNRNIMEVRKGNLEVKADESSRDELGQLGGGFNIMTGNLKNYIRNIQDEEASKRELEIMVLQSQINPHFIRNTLNIIRWMAEMMGVPAISKAIASFIRLINYNFEKSDVLVTVKEEVAQINEYIYLQKLRYNNNFRFKLDVDEDVMDCMILKLSFQPIVENSIIHGMEGKKGLGNLYLKGFKEGNDLVFIIGDDGVGMDKSTLEGLLKENRCPKSNRGIGGLGLPNVQKRIKLNFGNEYGMTIKSTPGIGTEVRMVFPIILVKAVESDKDEGSDC